MLVAMRDVLARYWVVAHIAWLAAFLAWVHGGARVELLAAVPWLLLAVLEMTLLLPPVRKSETPDTARRRVWRALVRDPLLYVGGALCLLLLFQFLNGGRKLEFDLASNAWSFSPPPVDWGPFCINPDEARQALVWFMPAFVAALGVRHGTTRRGKLVLLRALVANGALLSLCGMIQFGTGSRDLFWTTAATEHAFASFSYANHAGAFFTLLFAIGMGLFVQALLATEERRHAPWLGAALLLLAAGALLSLSRSAIFLVMALLLGGGCYAMRHAWKRIEVGVRLKALAVFILVLAFGAAVLFFAAPDNPVLREIRTVPWDKLGEETFGARWQQTVSAWHIWREHPWFGVGSGGFHQYVCLELDEARRACLHRGGIHVHHDAVQFLTEYGVVGFGLMLGAVAVLLAPVIQRLRVAHLTHVDGWTGERWLLFCVSPLTILILAGAAVTCLQSWIDLPFRSPAILVTWCIALACAPAFLSPGVSLPTANPVAPGNAREPVARETAAESNE
ncbi:MAG: O-antigen ligase family protein [bacterium]